MIFVRSLFVLCKIWFLLHFESVLSLFDEYLNLGLYLGLWAFYLPEIFVYLIRYKSEF